MCKYKGDNPEDPMELRKVLGDLLFHIRFPIMAFDVFMKDIIPTKILSDGEKAVISNLIHGEHLENCVFLNEKSKPDYESIPISENKCTNMESEFKWRRRCH